MTGSIWQAAIMAGPTYLVLSALLFVAIAISLARLKSIGVLNLENRNNSTSARVENVAHSVLKVIFTTILVAGLARFVIAPDYPGGIFALDWPMLFCGIVMFVSEIPNVGVLALMGKKMSDNHENTDPRLLMGAIALAAISSGCGQILAAAVANGLPVITIIQKLPALWIAVMLSGAILTVSVVGHFKLFIKLSNTKGISLKVVLADAAVTAFPTMLAILLAAITVSFA